MSPCFWGLVSKSLVASILESKSFFWDFRSWFSYRRYFKEQLFAYGDDLDVDFELFSEALGTVFQISAALKAGSKSDGFSSVEMITSS